MGCALILSQPIPLAPFKVNTMYVSKYGIKPIAEELFFFVNTTCVLCRVISDSNSTYKDQTSRPTEGESGILNPKIGRVNPSQVGLH